MPKKVRGSEVFVAKNNRYYIKVKGRPRFISNKEAEGAGYKSHLTKKGGNIIKKMKGIDNKVIKKGQKIKAGNLLSDTDKFLKKTKLISTTAAAATPVLALTGNEVPAAISAGVAGVSGALGYGIKKKKKRGRPKKTKTTKKKTGAGIKKKRGRPRKKKMKHGECDNHH